MFIWLRLWMSRTISFFTGNSADSDFDSEVREHLNLMIEENIRRGMTRDEAERQARIHFGGVEQLKETRREIGGMPLLESFLQDVRFAVRVLWKAPGFTVVAVLTLALGIGVNTTMFNAYNSVALKLLPFRDARSVVRVERRFASGALGNVNYGFSYPEYVLLRDHADSFSSLAAASWPVFVNRILETGEPERVRCSMVSGNYFPDLGIGAVIGRTIGPEDDNAPGAHPVVMLSNAYWERRFQSDPAVLGKVIRLNDTPFTIIGVAPAEFGGANVPPESPDVWAPTMMQAQLQPGHELLNDPHGMFVQLLGRMKPGANSAQARTSILSMIEQFADQNPVKTHAQGFRANGRIGDDKAVAILLPAVTLFGNTDDPRMLLTFALLIALVGTILLIGCANLANMLMARASGRQREFAVRLALGAGRKRLVRQLLTESLLLGLMGGIVGVVLSSWASWILARAVQGLLADFMLASTPVVINTSLDYRVFAWAMSVALLAGIAFGLLPALRFSKPDINSAIKNEGSTLGKNLGGSRMRSLLVASQAAASIFLLICAGLLTRGLIRSRAVRPGFETANAFALNVDYGSDPKRAVTLQLQVAEQLRKLPEIHGVTLSDRIPLMGTWTPPVLIPATQAGGPEVLSRTGANRVAPEFFATMGVPIVEGRTFTRQECDVQLGVAIISESAARLFWPGRSPLGKRAKLDMNFRGDYHEYEIVGVARDARHANLSRVDPAFFYLPVETKVVNNLLFTTNGDNRSALASVRSALGSVDSKLPSSMTVLNLEKVPMRMHRLLARISAIFALTLAGLALALAAVGIHGVMSYLVSQRVREIGIRMALGADARRVVLLVVSQGLRPVMFGALGGFLAAAGFSAVLQSQLQFPGTPDMLYGVHAYDPATFASLVLFLALVAMIASWVPARSATRVDPMVALRNE